jgi:hypothetical protein
MYGIVIARHKVREHVDISVRIPISEILVHLITYGAMYAFNDRAFHVGVSADAKLYALPLQHILKRLVEKLLAFVCTDHERTLSNGFTIFNIFENA